MAKKTDAEKLKELEEKMQQMKAKQQQIANRLKEKERKERTKRLIEVGSVIEKHFGIEGKEEALKLIYTYKKSVTENKEKISTLNIDQIKQELGEK